MSSVSRKYSAVCWAAVLSLSAAAAGAAHADIVQLRNGNVLEGEIVSITEQEVVIEMPGIGSMTVPRADVEAVEQPDPDPAEAAVPAPPPPSAAASPGASPAVGAAASGKKERTTEATYKRQAAVSRAHAHYSQGARAEPSSTYRDEYITKYLTAARTHYERAIREAQRALELDRRYHAREEEMLEMKDLVRNARERVSALNERIRNGETQARDRAREEAAKDKDRFKVKALEELKRSR